MDACLENTNTVYLFGIYSVSNASEMYDIVYTGIKLPINKNSVGIKHFLAFDTICADSVKEFLK